MNIQNTTNLNNETISDLLCDAVDIRNALRFSKGNILNRSKDNEDSETTIGDCLDNIIETLEELYN
jgi:hypothetical protein